MAKDFNYTVKQISDLRIKKDQLNANLLSNKQQLIQTNYLFDAAINNSTDSKKYQATIQDLKKNISIIKQEIGGLKKSEIALVEDLSLSFGGFDQMVNQMNDRYPILFFPVRIETIFNDSPQQLWLRVFPDEIAVDTHETELVDEEFAEGKVYWSQFVDATNEEEKLQAWDLLCRSFGAPRAAWVALQTTPLNLSTTTSSENLIFPTLETKPDSWSKQPVSFIMPDAFVVYAYAHDGSVITQKMKVIPDELKMGIDPALDPEEEAMSFDQQTINGLENELTTDEHVDWMVDFNAAVNKGMGIKLNLTKTQYDKGFKKIMVVGVKSTLTMEESKNRVERLLQSHHYTNGLSLLKQGDNTNNTAEDYAGFSAVEFGNKTTFDTERKNPLFEATPRNREKSDGQILCEALGIEYEVFHHIFQSNGTDINNAMRFNGVMFQALFGYNANELTTSFGNRNMVNTKLRNFFQENIRGRGALPSIRTGNQPYGILPTSVFSKLAWTNDPDRELLLYLLRYTQSLDRQWSIALEKVDGKIKAGQKLTNVLSKHAVSTEYIQRIGVGSGYVWNNIEYAALKYKEKEKWKDVQLQRLSKLQKELDLPLGPDSKALQINYLDKQSNVKLDLTMQGANPNEVLPKISNAGNLLSLLATATFDEIRDENYEKHGVKPEMVSKLMDQSLLYRVSRQSLMLEYYEAACEILKIPENERGENEFINLGKTDPKNVGPMGALKTGVSRYQVMDRPYGKEGSIGAVLSKATIKEFPQAKNLIEAKEGLQQLAKVKVKDLSLLLTEGVDIASYRFDTWRLSLVNQRLNLLRNIQDGSLNRNKGLYIGGYGWVENITRQTDLVPGKTPTTDNQFPKTVLKDNNNKGFIHAPSLNQAVNGAVMLSAYSDRVQKDNQEFLSVNLSSERIRAALDLTDGIRNGQNLGVLLGYEFERKFRSLYQQPDINIYIYNLRNAYPLDKFVVDVSPDPAEVEKITARNVVNGNKLIELLKEANRQEIIQKSGVPASVKDILIQAIDWIWNITDALADINTTEGVFQMVQGNMTKAGAMANSLSKGRYLHQPDVISSTKEGLEIPQKFTFHFETLNPFTLSNSWTIVAGNDLRVKAEPYIHKWLCTTLPSPSIIYCQVTEVETNIVHWVNVKEIKVHAVDLMYWIQGNLKDGDDQLSLIIKQYIRGKFNIKSDIRLAINYDLKPKATDYALSEVLPVLVYAEKMVNSARHLNTYDYLPIAEQQNVTKLYNIADLTTRYTTARTALISAKNALNTAINAATFNFTTLKNALFKLSFFGIEETIVEYVAASEVIDQQEVKKRAKTVLATANQKIDQSVVSIAVPTAGEDPTKYVEAIIEAFKKIFDSNFVVLPLFEVRQQEQAYLSGMLNRSSTLKNDHLANDLLTEQWVSSIARVKRNVEHCELVTILASTIHSKYDSQREILPLQVPYASDGTERWLGASVQSEDSLKEGRIAIGASVPNGHQITGNQVGILVDEWIDVVPFKEQTTGISFHHNQPNAKAPQCLILGLTPQIRGNWRWDDLIEMLNETLDLAKKRGVDYEEISATAVGQLPGMIMPFTASGNTIGLAEKHLVATKN